ncbi:MAG: glycoside hydrolase family 31 protein [Alphaproteobacteria bacterium]|nr:glycoside hydrolase family 31 protein [Alphaproteobacteria bacterium]
MGYKAADWHIAEGAALADATDTSVTITTSLGPLEITSPGLGMLRLRIGRTDLPDYGLMVEDLSPNGVSARTIDQGVMALVGSLALTVTAEPTRFDVSYFGSPVLSTITDQHFRGWTRLPALARREDGRAWLLSLALDGRSPLYGLGEKFGPLNKRSSVVISHVEDALGVNTELAYKNVPFCWTPGVDGKLGWGLFLNTPARVVHHCGDGAWSNRTYAVEVEDEALDATLIIGGTPAEVLDRFTHLVGKPPEPPGWSFGVWASRAYYRTADDILAAARELRERAFPCDVITFDGRAWLETSTRCLLEWDPARYPDPAPVLAELKSLGYRICNWEYPLVSLTNPRYAELAAKGYFLKDLITGEPYQYRWDPGPFGQVLTPLPTSALIDFTNPEAYRFWQELHKPLLEAGVDVMKTDFGEQVPDQVVAYNGDTGRRLHNVYTFLYNKAVWEATAEYRPYEPAMVWGRSAWVGNHRYPGHWGGDPQSDWGGLVGSIRGGLSWGLSGGAFHATDIGGFYGDRQPEAELYVRWVQAGVFSSHFRFHGIGVREPWGFGADAEEICREWFNLRMRLIPYLRQAARQASETGLPVMRAMVLMLPDEPESHSFDTQFFCGEDVLVAPITAPGGIVDVYLPSGRWYDLLSGEPYEGGRTVRLALPLDRFPVFAREGAMIPIGPVVQHTGEIAPDAAIAEVWAYGTTRGWPEGVPQDLPVRRLPV